MRLIKRAVEDANDLLCKICRNFTFNCTCPKK